MMRLVFVCMVGQTPLRPSRPVHCPPSIGPCSKIVGSNPCDSSQCATISPPRPARSPRRASSSKHCRTAEIFLMTIKDVHHSLSQFTSQERLR